MFFEQIAFAMSQRAGGATGGQGNLLLNLMPLLILLAIFYFLLIRPQQKKAKQHREMLNNLKKGDSIVTSGGLYGRIKKVSEDVLTVDLGNNQEVKMNRHFVSTLSENKVVDSEKKGKS